MASSCIPTTSETTRRRLGCSRPTIARGRAFNHMAWTTGLACTASTSPRLSMNATASTWPCCDSSASTKASPSPDRQWDLAIVLSNPAQRGPSYDELLERASWFYEAVTFSEAMKSQTPGLGQAYLGAYTDANGDWLKATGPTGCTCPPIPQPSCSGQQPSTPSIPAA